MKNLFLLTFTLLVGSINAMQPAPAPAPTGATPMQVEGAQQPTPKNQFVFHHSMPYLTQSALAKVTPEEIIAEDAALLAQKEKLESNPQLKQQYEELQQKITKKKREIDPIQEQIRDKNSEIDSIQKQIKKAKNKQKALEQKVALQKALEQKAILVEKEKELMSELSELIEQENKIQARKPASETWMTEKKDLSNLSEINTRLGEKSEALIDALNKKNLELFKQAIAYREIDLGLFTTLLSDAARKDLSITEFLVAHAENIPQEVFKSAFNNSHYTVVPFLLDKAFTQGELEQSPLHVAIIKNDLKKVSALIKKGEDVNKKISFEANRYFKETSPLHIASIYNLVAIAELLIENGAGVNAQDNNGETPLHLASQEGHTDITKLLIKNRANVDAEDNEDWTPLHRASQNGHTDIAKLLIENRADVNAEVPGNDTPLHIAIRNGHTDMTKLLIENGADINAPDDNEGLTPLHEASFFNNTDIAQLLIENGADVNAQDNDDETPLYSACRNHNIEIAQLLIKNGADVNIENRSDQSSPLLIAVENGYTDITKLFIENGANVNAQDENGNTPLHLASQNGHTGIAKLLIDKDANVNAQDKHGNTPLHSATRLNRVDIVKLLLTAGANTTIKDNKGKTALDMVNPNNTSLIDLLQKKARHTIKRELAPSNEQRSMAVPGLKPTSKDPFLSSQDEDQSMSVEREEEPGTTTKKPRI